jgi:hypothetical protein
MAEDSELVEPSQSQSDPRNAFVAAIYQKDDGTVLELKRM